MLIADDIEPEIAQIASLRAANPLQFSRIIMKNPRCVELKSFVERKARGSDMFKDAPDKIKVLNAVRNVKGFEYAARILESYETQWRLRYGKLEESLKWLIEKTPNSFSKTVLAVPEIYGRIIEQTAWIDAIFANTPEGYVFEIDSAEKIDLKTRIYCVMLGLRDFPACAGCGKKMVSNVLSAKKGFKRYCCDSCSTGSADV